MENMILTCIQCQEDFEFTVKEQEKLKKKGFDVPLRCHHCRKHKSQNLPPEENRRIRSKKRDYWMKFDEEDE